ncbi:hypothetical protein HHUSO_G21561 [Huso huso]|uniref:Uncharacterized protein n=1 Tax=Huso huso TaxID=61971 RepID=A0ABR0YZ83_HUSHU
MGLRFIQKAAALLVCRESRDTWDSGLSTRLQHCWCAGKAETHGTQIDPEGCSIAGVQGKQRHMGLRLIQKAAALLVCRESRDTWDSDWSRRLQHCWCAGKAETHGTQIYPEGCSIAGVQGKQRHMGLRFIQKAAALLVRSHPAAPDLTQLLLTSHSCSSPHTAAPDLTQLLLTSHSCSSPHTAAPHLTQLLLISHSCY